MSTSDVSRLSAADSDLDPVDEAEAWLVCDDPGFRSFQLVADSLSDADGVGVSATALFSAAHPPLAISSCEVSSTGSSSSSAMTCEGQII